MHFTHAWFLYWKIVCVSAKIRNINDSKTVVVIQTCPLNSTRDDFFGQHNRSHRRSVKAFHTAE